MARRKKKETSEPKEVKMEVVTKKVGKRTYHKDGDNYYFEDKGKKIITNSEMVISLFKK